MAITIDDYLQEIDPDNICGDDLQYDPAFIELEQAIKGKPEQQMGDTVVEAEPPNWRDIKKRSEDLLARTIDLRVLLCYLRALHALEGYPGLADGFSLLLAVVEKRWDNLHPQLDPDDDNDPTERVNVLTALCDYDTLLRPLQLTPLVESKALGRFNLRDISIASGKSTATSTEKSVSQSTIDGAVQDSEIDQLQQTLQAVAVSLETLNKLENTVTDYVGVSDAPSFAELRTLFKDGKAFLNTALEQRGVGDETAAEEATSEGETGTVAAAKSISGAINNNQDVIRTLKMVCEYYQKNEPSSPVPMFVERALRLVGKSFMDAIKDIAPDGMDQAKLILGKQDEEDE